MLDDVEKQHRVAAALETKGAEATAALRELRTATIGRLVREPVIVGMAYRLLLRGHARTAVEVFRIATRRFPSSANAWESLSEAEETMWCPLDSKKERNF